MSKLDLSVREIQQEDVRNIVDYFLKADHQYLLNMGVDIAKVPSEEQFYSYLSGQIKLPIEERISFCIIWLVDGIPIGHSNTNPTSFGKEAFMHLHIWKPDERRKGMGAELLRLTLAMFFEKLQLQDLYCQPYAHNPAPHATLAKNGFEFVKEYVTVPGMLNFEQPVKLWHMSKEKFEKLNSGKLI